jgi:hypothetical protein
MQQLLRLLPVAGIFLLVSLAWLVLSGTLLARSQSQQGSLAYEVGKLWGGMQTQHARDPHAVLAHADDGTDRLVWHG